MAEYNDEIYLDTLNALIGDIYYADGVSFDAKIARIRKLSEIVLRRLLGINTSSMLTLGKDWLKDDLDRRGMTERFFRSALQVIQNKGNRSSHSQATRLPTEKDFDRVSKAMTDLFAYLFYDYFKRYEFGTNAAVMSAFSTLPPHLRITVLSEFVYNDRINQEVIQKLALAAIKAYGTEGAIDWVEKNRERLDSVRAPFGSEDVPSYQQYFQIIGEPLEFPLWLMAACGSAYDYLLWLISREDIVENRPSEYAYRTFEEARSKYLELGIVEGDGDEIKEFNALTKFMFEGRKSEETLEFEQCIGDLTETLRVFRSYRNALTRDAEIGVEVVGLLAAAKNEIDDALDGLLQGCKEDT